MFHTKRVALLAISTFLFPAAANTASALTVTEAVNSIQSAAPADLPTVSNPRGNIGYVLANIFYGVADGTKNGKLKAEYLDVAGIDIWTASGSNASFAYSGNVGIGTPNPNASFEVKRNVADANFAAWFEGTGPDNYGIGVNVAHTGSVRSVADFRSGNVSRLLVRGDGNVGIGTASPAHRLDVAGDANVASGSTYKIGGSNLSLSHLGATLAGLLTLGNDAGGIAISNLPAPIASGDAANKAYVDAASGGGTSGRYQISCSPMYGAGNLLHCCRVDTQTGETQCKRATSMDVGTWYVSASPWEPESTIDTGYPSYFVLTNGTWNGNLGGLDGANAKCLSDLQTYDWMGKSSAGPLSSENVRAWLCDPFRCQNASAGKIYSLARSNSPSNGGAKMLIQTTGVGPADTDDWSSVERFGTNAQYWTNRWYLDSGNWTTVPRGTALSNTCAGWLSSSSLYNSIYGYGTGDANRFGNNTMNCNNSLRLVCLVN